MFDIREADWEHPEFVYEQIDEWPKGTCIMVNKVGGGTVGNEYVNEYWFVRVLLMSEPVMFGELMMPKSVDHLMVAKGAYRYLESREHYKNLFKNHEQLGHFKVVANEGYISCMTCGAVFAGKEAVGLCPGFTSALHGPSDTHGDTCRAYKVQGYCRHTCHNCECDQCKGTLG